MKKILVLVMLIYSAVFCIADLNPVVWYKMDDNVADTVIIDSKGYSNGTSVRNTSLMHTAGKIGGALSFDGTNDYIDTDNTFQSIFRDSFSISFWINPNEVASGTICGSYSETFLSGFSVAIGENEILVEYDVDIVEAISSLSKIPFDSWTHVVITVTNIGGTACQIKIYINGQLNVTGDPYAGIMASFTTDYYLYLGSYNASGSTESLLEGLLDDIRIFDKALSVEEISTIYHQGFSRQWLGSGGWLKR